LGQYGYGREAFAPKNDNIVSGRVESEDDTEVVLLLTDGQQRRIR